MKRPKRPQGESCAVRFWTFKDVVHWLDVKGVPFEDCDGATREQQALWWYARSQSAPLMFDLNVREMASVLIEGIKPIRPADVTRHLQDLYTDFVDGSIVLVSGKQADDVDAQIEADLKQFWEVKD